MAILNPYLSFKNNAREAMEFYQSVFGGTLDVSTFGDIPGMAEDPAEADLVMHSQLTTADGFTIMGSDTPDRMPYSAPAGVTMSISGDEESKLEGFWNALADGGQVTMPLDTPPWGGKFGMLVDRYGVPWMINVNAAAAA